MIGQCFFAIQSYPVFENWYPYAIQILFWLKPYYLYLKIPKVYYDAQDTFLCSVYFASWQNKLFYLQLNTSGLSSHMINLVCMSCLVDCDIL